VLHDVIGRAFERLGGDAARLGDDLIACAVDRRAGNRGGTRTPGAVAERNAVGVTLDDTDVVDTEAEPVGGDLRKRNVVALAVRMAAGEHRHFAVGMDAHHGALPAAVQAAALGEVAAWPGAGLVDEAGETNPGQDALPP